MRKITLFILLASCNTILTAQDSNLKKEISQLSDNLYEIVEIKKKDTLIIGTLSSVEPEIRNGEFKFYNEKGVLIGKGNYTENIPSGIWYYYNKKGKLTQEIDYNKTIEFLSTDTIVPKEAYFLVENMPEFQGGELVEFTNYIQNNLVYPIYSKLKGSQGISHVRFTVNESGKVSNISIDKSSGDMDLNIESIRVVSESPLWKPAMQKGNKVAVTYVIPVLFRIEK